jgi:septum formation protein
LLRECGLDFTVLTSAVEEVTPEFLSPAELCQLNAHRKARAVAKKCPDALVLAADTLVFVGQQVLGKPASLAEAREMLLQLSGCTHQVVTGVILLHLRAHRETMFSVSTEVRFRSLELPEIDAYLGKINPLDKAGAYAIQEHGEMVVEEISGSFSNVVGLPIERLQAELHRWAETS